MKEDKIVNCGYESKKSRKSRKIKKYLFQPATYGFCDKFDTDYLELQILANPNCEQGQK